MDKHFRIDTLRATQNPQQAVWLAAHQCYCSDYIVDRLDKVPDEQESGEYIVKHLLAGGRGHYSPFEVATIVFACGGFPHSLVQQLSRHRHLSFSIQSMRYTSQHIIEVADGKRDVEEVFYFRPKGEYSDRSGKKYTYSQSDRSSDIRLAHHLAGAYDAKLLLGYAEEHARELLPYNLRQHFVMACNARALMHLLDLRLKHDAQLEIQWFSQMLLERFSEWMPIVSKWYEDNRAHKAKLAP